MDNNNRYCVCNPIINVADLKKQIKKIWNNHVNLASRTSAHPTFSICKNKSSLKKNTKTAKSK